MRVSQEAGRCYVDARGRSRWPEAVSDGLTLPCRVCGRIPDFDYTVTDDGWKAVVPERDRHGVVCLPCFHLMALERGVSTGDVLLSAQFTGDFLTIVLVPTMIVDHGRSRRPVEEDSDE